MIEELFSHYLVLTTAVIEQIYLFAFQNIRAEIIIAIVALWFPLKEWWSKTGHDLEIVYGVVSGCYHQPMIYNLWIYNKKNKIEVITEINVLFGANCVLKLHEFDDNAFILNPYEMKKVNLDPVSIYASNCQPIDMEKVFKSDKIKQTFFLATPDGRVKAKNSKQIPHDTFISDTLRKGAFYYLYHRQYPVENRVLDFKIKYFGYCVLAEDEKYPFYIYQNGIIRTDCLKQDRIKIDLEKYDSIDKIKKFLLKQKLKDKKYTIEIFQRSLLIERQYNSLEEKDITPFIFSRCKYAIIEPLVRWYRNKELKKSNKKLKMGKK